MRAVTFCCLGAIICAATSANAQTISRAGMPQPTLQAGAPAYNIATLQDLIRVCSTPGSDATFPGAIGVCAGYISGVLDHHLVGESWSNSRSRQVCLPQQPPTRMETLQSLVAWDQANQQYNEKPAAEGVMRYFIATYPCGPSRSAGWQGRSPG
jgi:Ssp1 endopeptidase immunity protein Rap1a